MGLRVGKDLVRWMGNMGMNELRACRDEGVPRHIIEKIRKADP